MEKALLYGIPLYLKGHKSEKNKDKFLTTFKKTMLERYGVENPSQLTAVKEKKKQAYLKKYGVENPLQADAIRQKIRETNLKKYGVDRPAKSSIIKENTKKMFLNKYGVEHPAKLKVVQDKKKQTCLKKYGVEYISQVESIKDSVRKKNLFNFYQTLSSSARLKNLVKPLFSFEEYEGIEFKYSFQCVKCGNIFESHLQDGRIPRCYICYPILCGRNSLIENTLKDWLCDLNIDMQNNTKGIIYPYELDIYLPINNLAIEFNGLFWHSELGYGKCNKNYHLTKTNLCKEKGIYLIHIFEDEWINKQDIVKSIIKNKLGLIENKIYARECEEKEVNKEEALVFLMNNHLQESLISKYNYGLYHSGELVYLISLSKPRFNKNYEYELVRSCPKKDFSVLGGFSKLIGYVTKELHVQSLISYVDKRYFTGKGYKDWNLINETSPNYFYTKDYQTRESRLKYQKHKLESLFPDVYDRQLTEWEIMQLKGYDRIWDCGSLVYSLG